MRKIETIHEIELSSRCNLACSYCPSPTLKRPKIDMEWADYLRSLEIVKHFVSRGTQGELALTGVGEALLHPRFVEAVHLAREAIGDGYLTFSTNGILFTDEMAAALVAARPAVYISLHRPEVASKAVEVAKRHGLLAGTNSSFATSALDWVGGVDWHVSHPPIVCEYLRSGWAVIRADGTVGTCCWDAESVSGYLGNVYDEPNWFTAPHEACKSCSLIQEAT